MVALVLHFSIRARHILIVSSCSSRQFGIPSHTFVHGTHSPSWQRLPLQYGAGVGFKYSSKNQTNNNISFNTITCHLPQLLIIYTIRLNFNIDSGKMSCRLPVIVAISFINVSAAGNRMRRPSQKLILWLIAAEARNRPKFDWQTIAVTCDGFFPIWKFRIIYYYYNAVIIVVPTKHDWGFCDTVKHVISSSHCPSPDVASDCSKAISVCLPRPSSEL